MLADEENLHFEFVMDFLKQKAVAAKDNFHMISTVLQPIYNMVVINILYLCIFIHLDFVHIKWKIF